MAPVNTREKTNHKKIVEGDSLYHFQQHLEPSAFMPPQDLTHGVSLPSASSHLGGQLRTQPTAPAPTSWSTPPGLSKLCLARQSYISHLQDECLLLGRLPLRLSSPYISAQDELLDIREIRASARITCPVEPYRTEVVTLRPQPVPLYTLPP